jgi:ATP-binding cassette, subfamily B, multidrug efflux pump
LRGNKTYMSEDEVAGKAYDTRLAHRLYLFLRPYSLYLLLASLALLISSACQIAGPYLIKVALDKHITPGMHEGFGLLLLLYLAIAICDFISRFIQVYLTNYLGQKTMYDLRMALFRHLQNLSLSFFDRNPVGRLVTRVTTDVEALNQLFSTGLVTVIGDLAMIFGIMIMMLWLNLKLALITFAILPLLLAVTFYFRRKMREGFRMVRSRIARINAFLQEALSGMTIIQLFSRQEKSYNKFDDLNRDHMQAHIQTIFYYALFYPLIELIAAASMAVILWYGGLSVMDSTLTFGVLVAFIQYVEKFYKPISDLSEKYNIFQAAMAASERIFGLLDTRESIDNSQTPIYRDRLTGKVTFRDIHFAYNQGEPVLKGVSFEALPGEKIAIVGATGAGKSTIINLLSRFYDPQQGEILLDGVDLRKLDKTWLRSNIGLALQDVLIFSGTVKNNIALGRDDPSIQRITAAADAVGALDFIEKLPGGFDHVLTERGSNLSAGQRQLLSFARVMYKNPRILVLDEATSNVDSHTEHLIQQALERLITRRTSLIVAHRLSTIRHVNRIIVMHHGRIAETGTHNELLENRGIYYNLYQLQYKDQETTVAENQASA